MTVKQKQWQLYFLGFLTDKMQIDGIWGPVSAEAARALQESCKIQADGIFGPETERLTREIIAAIQEVVGKQYPLTADGLAGEETRNALICWQKAAGLPVSGIADTDTRKRLEALEETDQQDWWKGIVYFSKEEFRCKCNRYCSGYPAEMRMDAVQVADRARRHFGKPGIVVSGLRCRQHNCDSGGVVNSQHMFGEAIDLRIQGVSAQELLAFLQKQPEVRYAYRINETNVHFDVPKGER